MWKKRFRRLVSWFNAVFMMLTMLHLTAYADDAEPDYLALGDSISTGYGLENPTTESFPALLAAATGYTLMNKAVDGNTAAGIYAQMKDGALDAELADAERITITCGGNDMMGLLYQQIADLYNAEKEPDITTDDVLKGLAGTGDVKQYVLMPYATEALDGFSETEAFDAGLIQYRSDLTDVMTYIRQVNPTATVIVNTQYNPYQWFTGFFKNVNTNMNAGAVKLNAVILEQADELDYIVADVYTAFQNSEENLCNGVGLLSATNLDFHPNAAGHMVIAETVRATVCEHVYDADNTCMLCGKVNAATTMATTTTTTTTIITTTTTDITTEMTTNTTEPPAVTVSTDNTSNMPTPDIGLCGDSNVDGVVSLLDVIHLNKGLAELVVLSEQANQNADCNADGGVDDADAQILMGYVIFTIDTLPQASA